jgi:hypothetical protein
MTTDQETNQQTIVKYQLTVSRKSLNLAVLPAVFIPWFFVSTKECTESIISVCYKLVLTLLGLEYWVRWQLKFPNAMSMVCERGCGGKRRILTGQSVPPTPFGMTFGHLKLSPLHNCHFKNQLIKRMHYANIGVWNRYNDNISTN